MHDAHDGVAELWWENLEDIAEAQQTSQGAEAAKLLFENEAKFIDFTRSSSAFAQEHPIIGGNV